jgi:predicted metalloprotease with PDZ domain
MRKNFSYQRVYWGGACMAMRVDAAIRAKSKGTRTLDHVLRELYVSSLDEALDEDDLVAKLDLESGGIAGKTLNETRHVDLSKTYEVLRNKWP